MIVMIRISGMVAMNGNVESTLQRLRLRRKFACVVIHNRKELAGMIRKVENFVAYGNIDKKTLIELIKARGQKIDKDKKQDSEKIAEEFEKGKEWEELNMKPFFRMHPPRGGIDSKIHFPKGVLGNNKEKINDLIRRML